MSSTFSGITSALGGMQAARRGLEVAGQNIANARTEGYSRQRVETAAVGGTANAAFYATPPVAAGSVEVTGVTRMADAFLEARGRTEHSKQAYLDGREEILSTTEGLFDEPSDNGLQAQLTGMWKSWTDTADNPGDSAVRNQLVVSSGVVADRLNNLAQTLGGEYTDTRGRLDSTLSEINTGARRLADLNTAVVQAKQHGLPANELLDQRDQLALRLVELTGGTTSTGADGSLDVQLGGVSLVSGSTARSLTLTGSATLTGAAGDPATVRWSDDASAAPLTGGSGGALLEGLTTIMPDYLAQLDQVASKLATGVNQLHRAGFTPTGAAGGDFFSGTTAATIKVALTGGDQVATSSSATRALDGSNADAISALARSATGPDAAYRQTVVKIGMAVQTAASRSATQASITAQVDAARQSSAGVNLDEELTSMLTYQRSYEAAARVMSAVDSMLDTLINRTGR